MDRQLERINEHLKRIIEQMAALDDSVYVEHDVELTHNTDGHGRR